MHPDEKDMEFLALYMEENFDLDTLKEVGFFGRTKRTNYKKLAERVRQFFMLKSVFEYSEDELDVVRFSDGGGIILRGSEVAPNGELVQKVVGHISGMNPLFECPHCTCPNELEDSDKMPQIQICEGCKRKLNIVPPMFGGDYKIW